jgi:hypothetical protein
MPTAPEHRKNPVGRPPSSRHRGMKRPRSSPRTKHAMEEDAIFPPPRPVGRPPRQPLPQSTESGTTSSSCRSSSPRPTIISTAPRPSMTTKTTTTLTTSHCSPLASISADDRRRRSSQSHGFGPTPTPTIFSIPSAQACTSTLRLERAQVGLFSQSLSQDYLLWHARQRSQQSVPYHR